MPSRSSSPQKSSVGGKLSEEEYLTAPEDMEDLFDGGHPGSPSGAPFPPQYNEKTNRDENMSISGLEIRDGGREIMSSGGIPGAPAEGSIIGYGDIESGPSHLEERDKYASDGRQHSSLSPNEKHHGVTATEPGERVPAQRDQLGNNFYRSFDKIRRVSRDSSQRRSSANSRSSYGSRSHRDHHHRHSGGGGGGHRAYRRSQDDQDEHSSDRWPLPLSTLIFNLVCTNR